MKKIVDFKVEELKASKSVDVSRTTRNTQGGLNLVYTEKFGKRIGINQAKILDYLTDPTSIQFSYYKERYLVIGNNISNDNPKYSVRRNGNNGVVYNSELVKEVIDYFNLDFSHRSSKTYPVVDIQETEEGNRVVIDMRPEDANIEIEEQEISEETEPVELVEEELEE